MTQIDHTHDPAASSWVESANNHPWFPIQNLPFGVERLSEEDRIVVAIGDEMLDVRNALDYGYLTEIDASQRAALSSHNLNAWMALSQASRLQIRHAIFALLSTNHEAKQHAKKLLRQQIDAELTLPAHIGDFTDYYCGIHHAIKAGRVFRPDNPLLPNYEHMPLAYHGRASSIRVSGVDVVRPIGQIFVDEKPTLSPSRKLDFELELGMWASTANELGQSIPIGDAARHIAGFSLVNDWSARDIQAWEYRPLGPFQGKNFHATIAPWVITDHALIPFRTAPMTRLDEHAPLMSYLLNSYDQRQGGLDISLEIYLSSQNMRTRNMQAVRIAVSNSQHLYWTPAQMVTQHTLSGCNLRAGDLIATGTISTPDDTGNGSLLESTRGGTESFTLPNGEERIFLEDGDEVTFTAICERSGFRQIGFGECRAQILTNPQQL